MQKRVRQSRRQKRVDREPGAVELERQQRRVAGQYIPVRWETSEVTESVALRRLVVDTTLKESAGGWELRSVFMPDGMGLTFPRCPWGQFRVWVAFMEGGTKLANASAIWEP